MRAQKKSDSFQKELGFLSYIANYTSGQVKDGKK